MNSLPDHLISAYLDGTLDEAQSAELSQWLLASKDNARYLASLATLEHGLVKHARLHSNRDILEELHQDTGQEHDTPAELPAIHIDAEALTKEKYISALTYVLKHTFTPKRIATLATAAALLLGAALTVVLLTGPEQTQPIASNPIDGPTDPSTSVAQTPNGLPVATLTAENGATWAEGALAPGSALRAGDRLTLTQGYAEITTNRGAVAILEAPATIELLDNNALRLHAGKLVGICETPSSKGFLVRTTHLDITDIGTEFGVEVLGEQVTATVFVGEVELGVEGGVSRRLYENQTARVDFDSDNPALQIEDKLAQGFTERLPRPSVFTSASINDQRFQLEIALQGVYEDALLYSDRDYQMNGLDDAGIPAALLGGDLIRMPADARTGRTLDIGEIRVDAELSEPCDIYLIAAPDQGGLDWVNRDYEPTPMRIGLDQSDSFVREQAPVGLGVGPGESVDVVLQVWKRKQPAIGRVSFGPATHHSMYSIVAVPLDNSRPIPNKR